MYYACFSIKDCSSSLHRFQKYQEIPTRGAIAVEQLKVYIPILPPLLELEIAKHDLFNTSEVCAKAAF